MQEGYYLVYDEIKTTTVGHTFRSPQCEFFRTLASLYRTYNHRRHLYKKWNNGRSVGPMTVFEVKKLIC